MKQKNRPKTNKKSLKFLVIHGPNLNLLGSRERDIYGGVTIQEINKSLQREAQSLSVVLKIVQSNHGGDLVDLIGQARKSYQGLLINPAAYTHTSVAIRDALTASPIPAVEVHLSNSYKREDFRKISLTAPACAGQISGFGQQSYILGLRALVELADKRST